MVLKILFKMEQKSTPKRTLSDRMESPGIDPGASRMLSERSTIWASLPFLGFDVSLSEGIRFDHCRKDTISWVPAITTQKAAVTCGKREFVRIRRFYLKLADGLGFRFRV